MVRYIAKISVAIILKQPKTKNKKKKGIDVYKY